MKLSQRLAFIALMIVVILVSGCSSAKPPKEALLEAMKNTMEADSYSFALSLGIDELELASNDLQAQSVPTATIIGLLKDASFHVNGVYAKEPLQAEMNVEAVFPGLMNWKIDFPVILTEEKIYIMLPAIPLLPLPDSITGKYLMLDVNQLAADAEQNSESGADVNAATQQKLVQEAAAVVLKNLDEKTFFSKLKTADANLPEGMKADQVVQVTVNENNYEELVGTAVNQILPELIDLLLSNDTYLAALKLNKADIEQMKEDWDSKKAEIQSNLNDHVKIHSMQLMNAIRDQKLIYQSGEFNAEAENKNSGGLMKLGISYDVQYSELNQPPKFEEEIPTETVSIEQLKQLLQSSFGM